MNRRELLITAAAAPLALALPLGRGGPPRGAARRSRSSRQTARIGSSCVRLTDMRVVHSLAVPRRAARHRSRRPLRSALVMSNESGTITVLDAEAAGATGARGLPGAALRGRRSGRRPRLCQRRAGRAGDCDRRAARTCDRARRGGRRGAPHLDLAGRRARDHLARIPCASARARRRLATGAPRSCARSRPTTWPTTSASRPTASASGSARASIGAWRCTTRARCGCCTPCPATPRRSTSPSTAFAERASRRERRERDAAHVPPRGRAAPAHAPRHVGSYNVCALDGRVVTPSLDDGRLTLLDSRGLRSAHVAPHATTPASWRAASCSPASRPSRPGAP